MVMDSVWYGLANVNPMFPVVPYFIASYHSRYWHTIISNFVGTFLKLVEASVACRNNYRPIFGLGLFS